MVRLVLAKLDALSEDKATKVDFSGRSVLLYKNNGSVFAALDACTHVGGPLELQGDHLVCQWHGACFTRDHGKPVEGPAPRDLRLIRIPVRVENGEVVFVYGE